MFSKFKEYDRFKLPEDMVRVTAGKGGEAILIFGSERTFLHDCGMAYCGDRLVKNIEFALAMRDRKKLDGVLVSHTHYDHIGALPYVKERWKDAVIYGAEKAKKVFQSEGARSLMKDLGTAARDLYRGGNEEIKIEGVAIDEVVQDGSKIFIGDEYFYVLETKGHTDCSLTYVLEDRGIMLASESTGVMERKDFVHAPILKSFDESIKSALKCKAYTPKILICPHFGVIPKHFTLEYFDLFIKSANMDRELVLDLKHKGLGFEEILKEYARVHWSQDREKEQPLEAFMINAGHIVNALLKA